MDCQVFSISVTLDHPSPSTGLGGAKMLKTKTLIKVLQGRERLSPKLACWELLLTLGRFVNAAPDLHLMRSKRMCVSQGRLGPKVTWWRVWRALGARSLQKKNSTKRRGSFHPLICVFLSQDLPPINMDLTFCFPEQEVKYYMIL